MIHDRSLAANVRTYKYFGGLGGESGSFSCVASVSCCRIDYVALELQHAVKHNTSAHVCMSALLVEVERLRLLAVGPSTHNSSSIYHGIIHVAHLEHCSREQKVHGPDTCNRPANQSSSSCRPIAHASRHFIPERDPGAGREEGLPERAGQALREC